MVIFCFFEGSGAVAVEGRLMAQLGMDVAGGAEDGLFRAALLALATELLGVSFRDPVPFRWLEFCRVPKGKLHRQERVISPQAYSEIKSRT